MTNNLKIIFFGTPDFAAIVLEKMIEAGYTPIAVVTAPDKPVGRKQILTPSPVKVLAEKYRIPILQPEKIRNCPDVSLESSINRKVGIPTLRRDKFGIRNLKPDLIILAAFGQIIPKEILEIPKFGCLNVHPSLLPKYRGASPIQAAILNGDQETGVTIMLMDEKLDSGPIVAQQRLEISNSKIQMTNKFQNPNDKITYRQLHDTLAKMGAELLIETLPKWIKGEIKAVAQDDSKVTFAKIIKKEDGHISWHKSADYIERQIRAFNIWPTAYTYLNFQFPISNFQKQKMLKILKAEVLKTENKKEPGTVFLTEKKEPAVICKENALVLEEVQLEGKKIISAKEFLNGYPEIVGSILN